MELKEVLAAIEKVGTQVTTPRWPATSVDAQNRISSRWKAGKGVSLTGPIIDQVMPHVGACNAAADGLEAAGIGTHPTRGHAAMIRAVAAHLLHSASMGKVPHVFRESSYLGHDGLDASAEKPADPRLEAALKANDETAKSLKAVTDAVASLGTQIKDIQAKADAAVAQPVRKTLSAEGSSLLSKYGLKPEDGEKLTVHNVDSALAAAGVKEPARRIEAKLKLQAAGLLAAA